MDVATRGIEDDPSVLFQRNQIEVWVVDQLCGSSGCKPRAVCCMIFDANLGRDASLGTELLSHLFGVGL